MVRGVREARGEWIAFQDSDDEWTPNRNKELLDAAARVPEDVAWIFGDLRVVTDEGHEATVFKTWGNGLSVTEHPQIFADSLSIQHPFQYCLLQCGWPTD